MIVYGQTPEKVGPIRSARLIDVELPAMYDAALVFSGSSIGVSSRLFGSDFRARILRSYEPGYYRTGEDKPWEHTLYGIPADFWGALEAKELNTRPQLNQVMAFSELAPEGGEAISEAEIRYRDWTVINWRYQAEEGRYLRWVDGEEHLDANDGRQLSAINVILIFVDTTIDETICEFQQGDRCLAFSTEHHLEGEGRAIILRDGRAFEGLWRRAERHDLLTFVSEAGEPLPLQIGNSWIQVIPTWYEDTHTLIP
jgi:hypothetical protein